MCGFELKLRLSDGYNEFDFTQCAIKKMYARLVSLVPSRSVRVPSRRCLARLQAAAHLSSSVSAGAPVSSSRLVASPPAPLAPLRMLSFLRRRPLSTQSSGGGSGTVVDALAGGDQAEQIRKIAEVIRQRIAKETEELKRTYGSEQPDKVRGKRMRLMG